MTPRWDSGPAAHGLLLTLLLWLGACVSTPPLWAELSFDGLSYDNLWVVVIDLLDSEGFHVKSGDPGTGSIESDWLYGTSVREVRGPSRRKAMVEINKQPDVIGWVVRLRVREEVIRKGGMRATQLRDSPDWEEWHDDWDSTEYLAAKIRARLTDYFIDAKVEAHKVNQH